MLTEMQKNAKHISAGKKKLFEEAARLKNLTRDSSLGNFPLGKSFVARTMPQRGMGSQHDQHNQRFGSSLCEEWVFLSTGLIPSCFFNNRLDSVGG